MTTTTTSVRPRPAQSRPPRRRNDAAARPTSSRAGSAVADRSKDGAAPSSTDAGSPPTARFAILAGAIGALVMFGLVMVLSASSISALRGGESGWSYFTKQGLWAVIGLVALVVAYRTPTKALQALVWPILAAALVTNAVVLIPGLGTEANGSRAWLTLGPVNFQPSEVLKLAVLLYSANLLTRRSTRLYDRQAIFVPLLVVLSVSSMLVLAQRDLGSAIVLATIMLAVAFIAGAPLAPLTVFAGGLAAAGTVFALAEPYRRDRWLAFLDLAAHRENAGYQVWQSLIGIASGGAAGVGLGASRAKWGYLPESHTDFIFAIVAEELGLLGVTAVIGLYVVVLFTGVWAALQCEDRFSQLLAGGITAWVSIQALINIGGVVGVMPLTGLTLPFMSYGRTSLLVMMVAAGMLLRIARRPA